MYIELIAVLALLQFFYFGVLVGAARRKTGLRAPATTGNQVFERIYRVQMNTLETLVIFLPSLLLAGKYWSDVLVASVGAVYLIGRYIYCRAYVTNPATRHVGYGLSMLPTLILLVLALVGIGLALLRSGY